MRKGRVIAILCLSLILCFMCLITNTFSWFDRAEESGNTIVYRNKTLKQSSGKSFDVATYKQVDGGEYSEPLTNNTISKDAPLTLKAGERQCFKTQIKSNNTSKQNVSLYLSGVSSDNYSMTYVGVNNPMKTHKHLQSNTGNKVINDINKKNVYVGFNTSNNFNPADFSVHYWGNGVSAGDSKVASAYSHGTINAFNSTYYLYHAEIPYDATCVKPRLTNSTYYGADNPNVDTKNLIGVFKNSSGNTDADYASTGEGAGIKQFYSLATVSVGKTIDLSAIAQGANIAYAVENGNIATVDSNGVVTGKAVGETKLTLTATGAHGDTQTANCRLVVTGETEKLISVPVVTNMEISKYDSETDQNILTVYWYIKNTSSESINVSVDKINVTL